ncbi:Metallo-dependent phosphatase-like protein [Cryomyces antarcticus]
MRFSTIAISVLSASLPALACESCESPQSDVILTRNVRRMQPDAQNATSHSRGPLEWGQINFLHTTDTHGWLEGHVKEQNYGADWGDFISFTQEMRRKAQDLGVDLLLVDTGDLHDGAGLSDATSLNGELSLPIFEQLDYDLLTIGNHELYISTIAYETFSNFSKVYGERYLTSNVQITNPATGQLEYIGNRYRYFTTPKGLRIMAFGVLYDFTGNSNVTKVTKAADMVKQSWFVDAVNQTGIDMFVILGHNPARATASGSTFGTVFTAIRAIKADTPIQIFGGHSHIRDFAVYDDKTTALESGRYCETLGWLAMTGVTPSHQYGKETYGQEDYGREGYGREGHNGHNGHNGHHSHNAPAPTGPSGVPNPTMKAIPLTSTSTASVSLATSTSASSILYARRYLDWNRLTFAYHAVGSQDHTFDTSKGLAVTANITATRKALNLTRLYGCVPETYCQSCKPFGAPGNIFPLLQTALAATVINQSRANIPRLILINTGSIRFDLVKGPFTYDDSFVVSPFTDAFQFIPNVPYSIAEQVLGVLNSAPADKKRDLSSSDFAFQVPNPSLLGQDTCRDPAISRNHLTARSYPAGRIHRRQSTALTPGYVTTDDFGVGTGDDTVHTAIPYYSQPGNLQANASFPTNGTNPNTVDLIFLDYIAGDVLRVLTGLGAKYTKADIGYYLPTSFTTNSYLPAYAKLAWQANLPNCSVGLGMGYNDTSG